MEPLYEVIQHLPPHFDGHFGYRVYSGYVEYVDIDEWAGDGKPKYWSHQRFYSKFNNDKGASMERAVINFLEEKKLIKPPD